VDFLRPGLKFMCRVGSVLVDLDYGHFPWNKNGTVQNNQWKDVMSISSERCSGQTQKMLWNYSFAMLDYRYYQLEP